MGPERILPAQQAEHRLALSAWLREREAEALVYLLQENRTLRAQLGDRPLRLTNDQRCSGSLCWAIAWAAPGYKSWPPS